MSRNLLFRFLVSVSLGVPLTFSPHSWVQRDGRKRGGVGKTSRVGLLWQGPGSGADEPHPDRQFLGSPALGQAWVKARIPLLLARGPGALPPLHPHPRGHTHLLPPNCPRRLVAQAHKALVTCSRLLSQPVVGAELVHSSDDHNGQGFVSPM